MSLHNRPPKQYVLHQLKANLIYLIICSGCQKDYIGQTGRMPKERLTVFTQHIRQPKYQMIKVEGHLRTCGQSNFHILPFFQVIKDSKLLRESYESHFIRQFKPQLNQN